METHKRNNDDNKIEKINKAAIESNCSSFIHNVNLHER